YNPLETRFMQLVKKAGGRAYPGLKMLLYQGIIAFELWTGETITEEIANDAYAALLAQMNK
ncbi:MAG: shikimate dehydrogenase, partial [Lachnospiraceae bacterium]|nr:shikimate dehydrogenase [Lachnospiraceae bacterium]